MGDGGRLVVLVLVLVGCGGGGAAHEDQGDLGEDPQSTGAEGAAPPGADEAAAADAAASRFRRVCRQDGWCQLHPLPTGNGLEAVWASAPDDLYVGGSEGLILHFDGTSWRTLPTGTTARITAIWGSGPEHIVAVGVDGVILHGNRSGFAQVPSDTEENLLAVGGSGPNAMVAAGRGGVLLRWDGQRWQNQPWGTTQLLWSVYARAADDVYVGGTAGTLLHWDGRAWQQVPFDLPTTGTVGDVFGSETDLYVEMSNKVYARPFAGGDWRELARSFTLMSVALAGESEADFWALSHGKIVRTGEDGFEEVGEMPRSACGTLWANREGLAYCVGGRGQIYAVRDGELENLSPGRRDSLRGIWGVDESHVLAVGRGGLALRFDGETWAETPTGVTHELYDVWGADFEHAWAVGRDGVILRWNGTAWSRDAAEAGDQMLKAVSGTAPDDAWVVGSGGLILHWDGTAWSTVRSGTPEGIRGVWARARDEAYAFGGSSGLLVWDGTAWSIGTIAEGAYPLREVGRAVYVHNDGDGAALAFDGERWRRVAPALSGRGAFRTGGGVTWTAAETITRYDAEGWAPVSGRIAALSSWYYEVWAASATSVFAVGADGTIVHWAGGELAPVGAATSFAQVERERVAQVTRFSEHLREGRHLSRARRFEEAEVAFGRAVEASPQDPTALCERGWAAFRAGNFRAAGESLRQGLRFARAPATRGACLYNLGRLAEQQGNRAAAIERYHASLQARPHSVVQARLEALGAGAAPEPDRWAARCAPRGPLASLDDVCDFIESVLPDLAAGEDQRARCVLGSEVAWDGPGTLRYVYRGGRHVTATVLTQQEEDRFRVIGFLDVSESWNWDDEGVNQDSELVGIRQVIPGGTPELVFTLSSNEFDTTALRYECADDCESPTDEVYESFSRETIVCGSTRGRWACATGPGDIPRDLSRIMRCR